jgi:hypothetical protein
MPHKNIVNQLQSRLHSMSNNLLAVSLFMEDYDSPQEISQEEFKLIRDRVNLITTDLIESRELTNKLVILGSEKCPPESFESRNFSVTS